MALPEEESPSISTLSVTQVDNSPPSQVGLPFVGMILLLAMLGGVLWLAVSFRKTGSLLAILTPILAVGLFVPLMLSLLLRANRRRYFTYRGGFTVGVVLSLILPVLLLISPGWQLLLTVLGGLYSTIVSTLAFTAWYEGLWEDNYPPSAEIQKEVFDWHQTQIGFVGKGSFSKRIFDLILAGSGLILTLPLSLVIAALIWLEDPGPVLFVKNSTGKGGVNFHQYKFRTMVREAEKNTGPILASETDTRVLRIGRFLRKTALDELPQLWNILVGEMSFVGPRPQRTILVYTYMKQIPDYVERHRITPGLAGLAQVVGSYYMPPEEKLYWDQIYIRKASLAYDLRLIILALMIVFWLRWQKDWDEKIPVEWV